MTITYPKLALVLVGSALVILALFLVFSGGVALPTRDPTKHFQFRGLALLLLSLSPLAVGLLSLALAAGAVLRESKATQLAIGAGIISLGLAFVLAPKA